MAQQEPTPDQGALLADGPDSAKRRRSSTRLLSTGKSSAPEGADRRLLEREDALPIILHADDGPAFLLRLVI